jgi:gluconate 2-dehydrogenase gamma chain
MGSAAVAIGCAAGNRGDWEFLSNDQARTLTVICDRIIPADDFPSASQAGVITFFDRQLSRSLRRYRDSYRDGLERAEDTSRKRFGREIAALTAQQQDEVVRAIERLDHGFFTLLRGHTLDGYYGSPRHGGNRDAVSWRMLGLDEPPVRGRAQYDLRKGAAS